MGCVYIPVQNSDEEVKVELDQLPRDATDILDILKAEQAPLNLWLIIAREYFKQGKIEEFRQILEEGSSPEIDEYYADVRYDRIAILNALGAYYSNVGKIKTKNSEKEEQFVRATYFYNKASRIDNLEPSTWVGKGQLLLAKGDHEQAYGAFKIVLDGQAENIPALLGQACVQFNRGRYTESLELYKKALRAYPGCPAAVRLGLGLCRYKLGQLKKAKQAFERVLQLEPENVEAWVALGIMDLQVNEKGSVHEGMEKMQRAFELYPYCAMALNHLANHFFFTGQHFLVEQLTEIALVSTDHPLMKSHSYYNLARSYHSKGDYETAGRYYMASVKESQRPQDFVLPYFGLGQVQMKLGDLKSSLSNFEQVLEVQPENCESLKAVGHIYAQQGQREKALEILRKATRIDPRDAHAFIKMGELLISSDPGAAIDSLKTAKSLLKKSREEVPIELLNNIGVLHFERDELELAQQTFMEALGNGIWVEFINKSPSGNSALFSVSFRDMEFFHRLEEGVSLELPWDKVTTLFNLARLFEQLHDTEKATLLYRLILFKFPDYVDAYLRLAAMAQARNEIQLSLELIGDALKVDNNSINALCMLGNMELKTDDWLKAKETIKTAQSVSDGKDSYVDISLGNWNYFAALKNEKKEPKLEATHLEKARELYCKVLAQRPGNVYAANGAAVVLAERGQFDIAKEIFTQVQEAAAGNIFVQMPDVWVNLAHVYFAQGQFALAVKMYQNCLRKFYFGTDTQILLYLARTHYEAEQWQDCKRTLLRAVHLAPSNYMLRFDVGVAMQKFSTSTLQKQKRTADEVRQAVSELKNALRVFSQLSVVASPHTHGFDEKKIELHVDYCKHLLDAAKVHREAAEREEQQSRQKLEVARQLVLADEAKRKADEERRIQMERRKQEEELRRVMQQEEQFERVKELWKSKRKDRDDDDDEAGQAEKKRKKEKKKKKKDKDHKAYDSYMEEPDVAMEDEANYMSDKAEADAENAQDLLAAAGLEDSDDGETNSPVSTKSRRRRAYTDSEDDEPLQKQSPREDDAYDDDV
ncbi:hypothetical protein SUGI_0580760 [Cryptomeria japonica]|uniref:protein CTR9 homolog n=1 Tax=Cryptomeria japonica TaxID=3369 RepID=UPI00241493F6|nr:protein CTR9 homolog [Cryptomeria japonica]XP_057861409.2 protein CTR9 homolog [Cryptomeria japonica]XP_057861416.2 protein CTR9 homolog [Cryptomeria japonica]XP_057861422.2 protein CTR9 homolog [Cryptomeria japonica]GLJ29462.1 hypothetical protein SUGI_0580760 [Cryptomeria japonica]